MSVSALLLNVVEIYCTGVSLIYIMKEMKCRNVFDPYIECVCLRCMRKVCEWVRDIIEGQFENLHR